MLESQKPRLFIGSSSEGLRIAEAVFASVGRSTDATLWKQGLFLPGKYPLETLEEQLKRHDFAIFVASPDDVLVKREVVSSVARDNILVEFGLFAGVLGRRCVYVISPNEPTLNLPSDLLGISVATYDVRRTNGSLSDVRAAVEVGCQEILQAISDEWRLTKERRHKEAEDVMNSQRGRALQRLYSVSTSLRDSILVVQRDALAALSDRAAFEAAKDRAAKEVDDLVDGLDGDARAVGVLPELTSLKVVTIDALRGIPFPQELAAPRQAEQLAIDTGLKAFNTFLRGGDAVGEIRGVAERQAAGRIQSLKQRYSEWWDSHSSSLAAATSTLQDALFRSLSELSLQKAATKT
jgi:hypothetical protein